MSGKLLAVERADGKMTKADKDLLESHMQQIIPWLEQDDFSDDYITPWTYEDKSEALEQLPDDAEWVTEFNTEVERPETTWRIDITFYAFEIKNSPNTLCLLKLNWDDNWSRWEWSCVASMTFSTKEEISKTNLMTTYAKISLVTAGGGSYEEFLESWV